MYALLNVAFALLAGLLMTRIFSRWRLPDVTAFLVAGVLIGPFWPRQARHHGRRLRHL